MTNGPNCMFQKLALFCVEVQTDWMHENIIIRNFIPITLATSVKRGLQTVKKYILKLLAPENVRRKYTIHIIQKVKK